MNKKEKDIRKLLVLTGYNNLTEKIAENLSDALSIPKEIYIQTNKILLSEESVDYLNNSLVKLYDDNFSHQEIKSFIDFYSSKTGKKLVSKLPEITAQSMELGKKWGQEIMENNLDKINNIMEEYYNISDLERKLQ